MYFIGEGQAMESGLGQTFPYTEQTWEEKKYHMY